MHVQPVLGLSARYLKQHSIKAMTVQAEPATVLHIASVRLVNDCGIPNRLMPHVL